jgi:S1-C subfamily serine protease
LIDTRTACSQRGVADGGSKSCRRFTLFILLGASVLAGCGSSAHQTQTRTLTVTAGQTASRSAKAPSDPLASLVAKSQSGVIRIETNACGVQEIGTGFLIGPRLIATVEHVVDGASAITLKQGNKIVGRGTVIGEDQARDVALVRSSVPITGAQLRLATRSPALGDSVAALGFPLGLPFTVTQGSVSGLGRTIPINGVNRQQLVQTDAAVNPGNSGGPLMSLDNDQVLGLVDLGTNMANGIGFAVSAQVAAPLLQAWNAAPQPIPTATCPSSQPAPVADAGTPGAGDSGNSGAGTAAAATGPADVLQEHLSDLGSGQYQAAFELMSSAYQAQNPGWVQDRNTADPSVNIISIGAPQYGSATAHVPVDFYARDANPTPGSDTKCREFSGTAALVQEDGSWRYDPATNQLTATVQADNNPNCP